MFTSLSTGIYPAGELFPVVIYHDNEEDRNNFLYDLLSLVIATLTDFVERLTKEGWFWGS